MVERHVRDKRFTLLVSFVSYKKTKCCENGPTNVKKLNKGSMGLGPELIKAKAIITDL
jgi:hypothetical protein